jgi:DNA adenine methylase
MEYQKVKAAAPVAPWMGGKKALHRKIIERIEKIEHVSYVEPFVGMGGVFLRRQWRPKHEVANDRNGEITNLFRILQRHYPQLIEILRFQITSRREFERLRQVDPSTLTDLERAARFLYLQRLAFGGQVGGVFGVTAERAGRFNLSRLEPVLEAARERLEGVVLENLDWMEVIDRYDSPGTLFYLDPPYWGGENDYGKGMFGREQFALMSEQLATIEGAFVLSMNDLPAVRDLFAAFDIEPMRLKYTVSQGEAKEAAELLITNRKVEMGLL